MIIKKLTICGFGPYKEKTTIDFESLSQDNIFLIYGNTGSGKTSIFDAIVYALYGDASGTVRKTEDLVSNFKDIKELTYVYLTFICQDKLISIKRYPKQVYLNNHDKKVVKEPKVELTVNNETITKISEVNEYVNELLHLTKNQFKQIVMLPQGEFRKLLLSSSLEKEAIFRNIFNTEIYQNIQNLFKTKLQKIEVDLNEKSQIIQNNIINFSQELAFDNYEKSLTAMKESLQINYEEITSLGKIIAKEEQNIKLKNLELHKIKTDNQNYDKYHQYANSFNELKKDQNYYEKLKINVAKLELYKDLKYLDDAIKESKAKLSKEQINLDKLKIDLQDNQVNLKLIEEEYNTYDKSKVNNLYAELLDLKEVKIKLSKLDNYLLEKDQLDSMLVKFQRDLLMIEKELKVILKNISESENLNEYKAKLNSDYTDITLKLNVEENYLSDYLNKQKNHQKQIVLLDDMQEEYETKQKLYFEYLSRYTSSSAAFLAHNLKENEPCPVCGSVIHPKLAKANSKENVTKELYEKANKAFNDIQAKHNSALIILAKYSQEFEDISSRINNEYDSYASLKSIYADHKQHLQSLNDEIEKLTHKIKFVKEQKNLQEQLQAKKDKLLEKINNYNNKLAICKTNIENNTVKEYTSEKIDAFILDKENSIEKEKSYQEKLLNNVNKMTLEVKSCETSIQEHERIISQAIEELEKQQVRFTNYVTKNQLDLDDYQRRILEIADVKVLRQRVQNYFEKYEALKLLVSENAVYSNIKRIDVKPIEIALENLMQNKQNLQAEMLEKNQFYGANNNIYLSTKKVYEEYLNLENTYNDIATICNSAIGKNPLKLSFESYILTSYFDELINVSNDIFYKMTNTRYLLKRKESLSGNAKSGLDLEVFDTFNNASRNITSLSGGEQFKASLALALSLAKVINYSQSVRIDTLFIDEGFGSLDSDSLRSAIDVIMEYSEGKIVGIISHVEELKEQIPTKLQVISTKDGSKIVYNS